MIDLDEQLLPDQLTLPMVWLGLLANINGMFTDLTSAVIGAAAGYMRLVAGVPGVPPGHRTRGYGLWRFQLLAVFGAFLGWQLLPLVVLLSSLLGAVVGITLILVRGRDRQIPIPFGRILPPPDWWRLLWASRSTAVTCNWPAG